MDLKDVTKDLRHQTNYRLEQRMNQLLRTNPNFHNLSQENREVVKSLITKYQDKLRRNQKISDYTIRHDRYRLYQNRLKSELTKYDLDQIGDLLESFKN